MIGIVVVLGFALILYLTGAYTSEDITPDQTSPTPTITADQPIITSFPATVNGSQETMTIQVFFNNLDQNDDCSAVFPLQREIAQTQTPARSSMELLVAGPTNSELDQGYTSSISNDTKINSIRIENGTAYVDFNEDLDAAGSCMVLSIRSQITQTLLQFPTVNNVVISIDGETEEILQP